MLSQKIGAFDSLSPPFPQPAKRPRKIVISISPPKVKSGTKMLNFIQMMMGCKLAAATQERELEVTLEYQLSVWHQGGGKATLLGEGLIYFIFKKEVS